MASRAALCLFLLLALGAPGTPSGADGGSRSGDPDSPAGPAAAPGAAQAPLRAVDPDGLRAALESRRGKVVVLNFWATWCEPCREEFPDLVRFAGEHAGQVALVTVSLDDPTLSGAAARSFLDEMKAPGLRLIKGSGDPDTFINSVDPAWSGALPATFIHRADGTRAHAIHATIDYAKLGELVGPLLDSD